MHNVFVQGIYTSIFTKEVNNVAISKQIDMLDESE